MELKNSNKFLLILLGIDCIFILLSFFDRFSSLNFNNFLVQSDGLYAEKFQYLKFLGIAILSLCLAIKRKAIQFFIFTIIPLYLYWDDSRSLHENFGTKIASFLHEGSHVDTLISNFRYQDIGEIIYMSLMAFALLIIFLISYKLSDKFQKYFLKKILKLFLVFGFFALFIDSIHQLSGGLIYDLLTIVEDGGEMIPISFMAAYFFEYLTDRRNKLIT